MYEHTPNLKHTIVNKGSMKTLRDVFNLEMKEHDHGEILFFKDASGMDI